MVARPERSLILRMFYWLKNQKNYKYFFLIAICFCIALFSFRFHITKSAMGGDAVWYFIQLRSIAVDHDVNYGNEQEYYAKKISPYTGFPKVTPQKPVPATGYIPITYSVGTAILWLPFFMLAHIITKGLSFFGLPIIPNGYTFLYEYFVGLGSMFYGFLGIICLYFIGKRFFDDKIAVIGSLAIWFGTPLLYYMSLEPVMSHSTAMFSVSVFIAFWLLIRNKSKYYYWGLLGLIGGIMAIVRPQDLLFFLIPGLDICISFFKEPIKIKKEIVIKMFLLVTAGLLPICLQFFVNYQIYGKIMLSGYHRFNRPLLEFWYKPKLFQTLFMFPSYGLITIAPVIGFSLVGLYFYYKQYPRITALLAIALLVQWYVMSSLPFFLEGHSYGNRQFLSATFIFGLGLMAFTDYMAKKLQKKLPIVFVYSLFVISNFVFMVLYSFRIIGPEYGT